jgi:hypothetical protein
VEASLICDTLGAAGDFIAVAEGRLLTKAGTGFVGDPIGSVFDGSVCATRAILQAVSVRGGVAPGLGSSPPVIAAAVSKTAIGIRSFHGEGTTAGNYFDGDLLTGGGGITGTPTEHFGAVDTSGTDPRVERCRDAFDAARAASATFAALAPTLNLGKVYLRRDEVLFIDARGGAVVQLDSLTSDATGGRFAGENRLCDRAYEDGHEPPRIHIVGNPADEVVINTPRLGLGSCTQLDIEVEDVIVNVPGTGPTVRIGYGVGGDVLHSQLPILAPERNLVMDGSIDDDHETRLAGFWVRNARLNGNTQSLDTMLGCRFQ